ncbi:MAG: hypothetical protein OXF72_07165 [Gammaproteobacteria bacterium]|nr:hypothetical protein [Gammaproteobacteria bacterium]MCY4278825.1 hypothetical protein [Gammaproteobacteria bacterium]
MATQSIKSDNPEPADSCDWRLLLETPEEFAKRIDEEYIVDEETGDILGRRLTPYEQDLLAGYDWYKMAKEEPYDDFFLEDPTKSLGR